MKYAYVSAIVQPPDPQVVSLFNSIAEQALGEPRPDVIPPCHPAGISFRHVLLDARDDDEAYCLGPKLLEWPQGAVCNDYVFRVDEKTSVLRG